MTYAEALAAYRASERKEKESYGEWQQARTELEQARVEELNEKELLENQRGNIAALKAEADRRRADSEKFKSSVEARLKSIHDRAGELVEVEIEAAGRMIIPDIDELTQMSKENPEEYEKMHQRIKQAVGIYAPKQEESDRIMNMLDDYMQKNQKLEQAVAFQEKVKEIPADFIDLVKLENSDKEKYKAVEQDLAELIEDYSKDPANANKPGKVKSLDEFINNAKEKQGNAEYFFRSKDPLVVEQKKYIKKDVIKHAKDRAENDVKNFQNETKEAKKMASAMFKIINEKNQKENKKNKVEKMQQTLKNFTDKESHDTYVNQALAEEYQERLKKAQSRYRSAAVGKFITDVEEAVVNPTAVLFRNCVFTATEALIRADLTEKKKALEKATADMEMAGNAQIGSTITSVDDRQALAHTTNPEQQQHLAERADAKSVIASEAGDLWSAQVRKIDDLRQEIRELEPIVEEKVRKNQQNFQKQVLEKYGNIDVKSQEKQMEELYELQIRDLEGPEKSLLEARHNRQQRDLQEIKTSMEADTKNMNQDMIKISKRAETLSVLLTPENLSTSDSVISAFEKVVNVGTKIYEYVSGSDSSDKKDEKDEDKTVLSRLQEAKKKLTDPKVKDPNEHVLTELIAVSEIILDKVNAFSKDLNEKSAQNYHQYRMADSAVEGIQEEQNSYQRFAAEHSEELKGKNSEERFQVFYADKTRIVEEFAERDAARAEHVIAEIEGRVESASTKKVSCEEKEQEKLQAVDAERINRAELSQNLKKAFAEAVQEADAPAKPVTLTREDIFREHAGEKDAPDFTFLSRLTGTQMSADMKLDDAMDAFGKIYINGLNAIDYFDLRDKYETASLDKPEKQKELIESLAGIGEDMKAALQVPFDPSKANGLSAGAARLAGQMIAVEDEHLHLAAVQLDAQDTPPEKPVLVQKEHVKGWFKSGVNEQIDRENAAARQQYETRMAVYNQYMADHAGIDAYNRNSKMITDEFQKMRQIAAETTLKQAQPEIAAGTATATQGATKVTFDALMQEEKRNQNLTKAVHQSRNLHLADAEKTVLLQDEVKAEQKKAEQKAPEQQAPEQQAPEQKAPEKKTRVQAGPQM
jgi:hypothetical protein